MTEPLRDSADAILAGLSYDQVLDLLGPPWRAMMKLERLARHLQEERTPMDAQGPGD